MVKVARRRMLGEAASSEIEPEHSSESLRLDMVRILHNAWRADTLVVDPATTSKKRESSIQEGGMGERKRQKVAKAAPEFL